MAGGRIRPSRSRRDRRRLSAGARDRNHDRATDGSARWAAARHGRDRRHRAQLPSTIVQNAAKARVAGAELELAWLPPVDGLELEAFFGLTLPGYEEFADESGDRSNERFDFVAEKSYSISGAYAREIFRWPWLGRVDWSWKDDVPASQGPNITYFRRQGVEVKPAATQPPTGILNVRSAVTLPAGIALGLWGRNLTDERTFTAIVLGGGIDFVAKINNNAPREFGGDLTVRF